jgi:hypothetical protein
MEDKTVQQAVVTIEYWIPKPRVLHPYPEQRFAATHPR